MLWDFLRGQLLVAIALGILYTLGLLIIRAPLALIIGPLAGVLSLVPYMGFILGIGLASLLILLEYQGLWQLVGVALTFGIAQTIEGWVLTPKLVGDRVGLHPVWVLVALLLGGECLELPGWLWPFPWPLLCGSSWDMPCGPIRKALYTSEPILISVFIPGKACLLCDEFEALLQPALNCRGFHYRRIDVDSDLAAKERFGKRIPVLEINGEVVAEGHTTPAGLDQRIENFLKRIS